MKLLMYYINFLKYNKNVFKCDLMFSIDSG